MKYLHTDRYRGINKSSLKWLTAFLYFLSCRSIYFRDRICVCAAGKTRARSLALV
jgi:hypothetical protein